ncbi:MAG TPA: MATE family efflux transporter [Gammaproteobacteria bacterium]|nr:MATE family efflux transporter [Gammaproteobacteria bacterium]
MNAGPKQPAIQDLTQGPVRGHLVRMTIPMFLGISSMIVASMVETIYIGVLGADELAAFSFTFPLIMGLSSLSMGIGSGAASIIARAQGRGDRLRVKQLTTHALILTTVLVFGLVLVGYALKQNLFALMGADERIGILIKQYTDIWILGLALFTWPMVVTTVLRAVGNARLPGLIMTSSSALQIVVAPLLIFGLLGSPELGFVGSAWASIFTGLVRTIAMFWVLIAGEDLLVFSRQAFTGIVQSSREILYIGVPSMLNSLIGPVSMAIVLWLLSEHGSEVVAGFGITSRFEMLATMVLMSLSASIGPFVGQNWGARQTERVYQGLSMAYKFCLLWGLACFALLAPFGDELVMLVNDNPLLVESAGWYLLITPITFGILGIGMVSGSLFVALGKPMPTTILSLLRMFVFHIPLAVLLNSYWGYIGIFIATAIANIIIGGIALVWSRRVLAREINLRL